MVCEDRHRGRADRQAQRQDGRGEGQCLRRRRADDERLLDARRLRAQHRRDHRHAAARRGRDHQGQGALRNVLPFRRQPYRGVRPGAQPLQTRLFRRRLIVGERRAGRGRRGRFGDRRRPGRIDPHALLLLRHLRHEADARPRALHRRDADRIDDRSHRSDDGDGCRQRVDAGGARGARRPRPEAIRAEGRRLHGGA